MTQLTKADIIKTIEQAKSITSKWPTWKRNLLTDSAKPKFDKPREVIK